MGSFWELFEVILVAFWGSGAIPANISEQAAKKVPFGAHLGAKIGQVGGKMALSCPTWRQDGPKMALSCPTWRQDVPKIATLEAKMANLAHFWEHVRDIFWILGTILPKMSKSEKTTTVEHF